MKGKVMKTKKSVTLKEKFFPGAHEVPSARALDMFEITENNFISNPFPIALDAQKRLLELIYNRKSGIITRQELIDVLFNPEGTPKGTIIRRFI